MGRLRLLFIWVSLTAAFAAQAATPIQWHKEWNDAVFAQATREHKFVILDLHAVWCHWCHVMDDTTYRDAQVRKLLGKNYIAVSIDADNAPDLTSRYGEWGWPATIVLAADGTEIVKRRGYIPPAQMASLLQAIVADPSPGPSVREEAAIVASAATTLPPNGRNSLQSVYDELYDDRNGGWGRIHKYVDAPAMELAFAQADDGVVVSEQRARQTLNANMNLIDPVWGGVYQYSDELDWRSPHYEKLIAFQADNLRLYAESYARWGAAHYLAAATALYNYIDKFLTAADGGFYVSQDADVSAAVSGRQFYASDAAGRLRLGTPRIDMHEYARETGWVIRALSKYFDVTGDRNALQSAERAARWALQRRALVGGGFSHDAGPGVKERGGPFLDDNVAMAQGFVALYRSTGDREWLQHARDALNFIDTYLRHADSGYIAAPLPANGRGVFREAVRSAEHNAALARVANLVNRYSGEARFRAMAEHAMKYLAAFASGAPEQLRSEILLADRELARAPIHIAIVGGKHDPAAEALHAAALRYPADYLQIDWLDRAEGPLPNPETEYPQLKRAAAFACTDGACSTPVYEASQVSVAVRNALAFK